MIPSVTFPIALIGSNRLLSEVLNHIWNWQELLLKRASIGYIVSDTKHVYQADCPCPNSVAGDAGKIV